MKIAISGAGIAGPTLAYWLSRSGHDPVLIETAPQLRTGGYLIDFWGVGYAIAERMGLADAIQRAGYGIDQVRLVDGRGRKTGGFAVSPFRRVFDGRYISLPRGELARLIYEAVGDDVETVFGDRITAIDQRDEGVHVAFEHSGRREFDLVIGADGVHSAVRGLAFGAAALQRRMGYWVAAFEAGGYRPRDELVYLAHNKPGRLVARFAQRNDRTMFLFVVADDQLTGMEPADDAEVRRALRQVFGDDGWECPAILAALDRAEDLYFDRVSQIKVDRWSQGRVALIGDAASCVSLLAGEGTGLAMLQAYVLAGELDRARGDHRAAFRRYEQLLRPLIEGKQESARAFAGALAPRTSVGLWTRNRVSRLLDIPALAAWAIRREFRDDIELPDYTT
ncbi:MULTISPECIES: FAD-binding domain [unclassified Mycobacterium]|uniref:FAD-binding domain n=1 Tax=unclassified Mycobacterium TaxID=2642494 RepID=UPI00048DD842|nr:MULTISPECIES: FAD-binding domain [unclassified Mycobacterium]SEA71774.1 2-polyprenyl-6-methoxyphenol hydroxylase [Mycobacterium sp. 283mftsu]